MAKKTGETQTELPPVPPGFVRMWPFGSDVNALTVDGEEYSRYDDGSFLIRSEHVGAAHSHYLTEKLDAG